MHLKIDCFLVSSYVNDYFCLYDFVKGIVTQTKEQIKYLLGVSSHRRDRSNKDDDELESIKDTEASWDNTCLCT